MPGEIDARISPALDPETYRAIEGYNDHTRPFVDDVVAAYADIHHALGKIHDARALADSNPAWTPEARIAIVGKESAKQRERVLTRLARAERDLRARIEHTEKLLSEPLTERAGLGTLNSEVRALARSLDRPERTALIRDAMEGDDDATLTALLGAQHFLSGLSKVDADHYLHLYHSKRSPHLVARLALMNRFLEMVERNTPVVHVQFDKAVGASPNDVRAITIANDRAVAALRIEPVA